MLKNILIGLAIVVGILAIAGAFLYFWVKGIWDKITFGKPVPTGIDLNGLTLTDVANVFLSGTEKNVFITLSFPIKNESDKKITISKFRMILYYDGEIIGQTSDKLYNTPTVIYANDSTPITDTVNVKLNQSGVKLVKDKFAGKKLEITYTIDINVMIENNFLNASVPVSKIYPIKDSFIL